jgi:16S rRNA (guanine527-N7)-methyltransferase
LDKFDRVKPKPVIDDPDKVPDAKEVNARLSKWFKDLSPETVAKLVIYHSDLIKFNKAVNLISTGTIKNAESVHLADSILASQMIAKALLPNHPVYDFGSGNGFPGLVMAILYPDLKVILVDRDKRKLEFLKHVIFTLKLANCSTEEIDVEKLPDRSVFNVVSRGFAPLPKSLILCRKSIANGGKFFHLKSDGWAGELASVPTQLFSFWNPSLLGQYRIPGIGVDAAVILTDKIAD